MKFKKPCHFQIRLTWSVMDTLIKRVDDDLYVKMKRILYLELDAQIYTQLHVNIQNCLLKDISP